MENNNDLQKIELTKPEKQEIIDKVNKLDKDVRQDVLGSPKKFSAMKLYADVKLAIATIFMIFAITFAGATICLPFSKLPAVHQIVGCLTYTLTVEFYTVFVLVMLAMLALASGLGEDVNDILDQRSLRKIRVIASPFFVEQNNNTYKWIINDLAFAYNSNLSEQATKIVQNQTQLKIVAHKLRDASFVASLDNESVKKLRHLYKRLLKNCQNELEELIESKVNKATIYLAANDAYDLLPNRIRKELATKQAQAILDEATE